MPKMRYISFSTLEFRINAQMPYLQLHLETIVMTNAQKVSYVVACRPLIEWISINCHPHTKILLDSTSAEIVEGVYCYRTDDFLQD